MYDGYMTGSFETLLLVGGKSNSLGKVDEVIRMVLADKSLLKELYGCMFHVDPWVRMRAADAFEKVCRKHPEWIEPYVDRIQEELSGPDQQASIQWHLAEIYRQVTLTSEQKQHALNWLVGRLSSIDVDWIVAANTMTALAYFVEKGDFSKEKLLGLLKIQLDHKSKSVVKKATKSIDALS